MAISNDWKSLLSLLLFGGSVLTSSSLERPIAHLTSTVKQYVYVAGLARDLKAVKQLLQVASCLGIRYIFAQSRTV